MSFVLTINIYHYCHYYYPCYYHCYHHPMLILCLISKIIIIKNKITIIIFTLYFLPFIFILAFIIYLSLIAIAKVLCTFIYIINKNRYVYKLFYKLFFNFARIVLEIYKYVKTLSRQNLKKIWTNLCHEYMNMIENACKSDVEYYIRLGCASSGVNKRISFYIVSVVECFRLRNLTFMWYRKLLPSMLHAGSDSFCISHAL